MNKGFLKKCCQIEYILILLSALTFIPTEILKNHTNESFAKLDQSFLELQSAYGNTQISAEEKDIMMAEIQRECLPYIYFSTELKHKLIRVLELCKYDAISWNTNHSNSTLFTSLIVSFYSNIKKIQATIIFGYDCMLYCAVFLLSLAALVLISKKNTKIDTISDTTFTEQKKDFTAKDVIIYSTIILIAVLANYLGSLVSRKISIPLYLDSILTIGVTALCGLSAGIICAILSNVILYITDATMIIFVSCHILTAILASLTFCFYKKNKKTNNLNFEIFLWAGFWIAISNAILGDILANAVFDSATASPVLDGSILGLYVVLKNLTAATYLSGLLTNFSDKLFSACFSYLFYLGVKKSTKLCSL